MWVTHLSLANFRNYAQADIEFKRGANLLLGRNGQGKTNVAEAISYFAFLASHRTTNDVALIKAETDAAIVRMRVTRLDREILLELQLNREGRNRAQLNRAAVKPRELTEYFSCVVFAPEDLLIVRGDPGVRRKFLDETLLARNPALASTLSEYERVVKQRTALLKSARSLSQKEDTQREVLSTLDIWNERLVALGSRIIAERERLVRDLIDPLAEAYRYLVDADHAPLLSMQSTVPRETSDIEHSFREALAEVAQQERDRAVTLAGPHRDELLLSLNALPVKGYASHGETWSFVLALRLATARLLQQESNAGDPVLILDDVFAELDTRRRKRLFEAVREFDQVIVTAAVADDVPENINWHTIHIEAGEVVDRQASA